MDVDTFFTYDLRGEKESRLQTIKAFYDVNQAFFSTFAQGYKRALDSGTSAAVSFLRSRFSNEGFLYDLNARYVLIKSDGKDTLDWNMDALRYTIAYSSERGLPDKLALAL